jgi:hypothetical protein
VSFRSGARPEKKSFMRVSLGVLALTIGACGVAAEPLSPPVGELKSGNIAESREVLGQMRSDSRDSYVYTRRDESWTGFGDRTTFEVRNGSIVLRKHEAWERDPVNGALNARSDQEWEEQGSALGTHEGAHPMKTIPELYDECESEVLTKDPMTNDIGLLFHANGILAVCTYWPHGCQDDCATGPTIESVTF